MSPRAKACGFSSRPALPPKPPPTTPDAWDDESLAFDGPGESSVHSAEAAAVTASSREIELAAKNDVLQRTAAELSAEVYRLKHEMAHAKPTAAAEGARHYGIVAVPYVCGRSGDCAARLAIKTLRGFAALGSIGNY